ncbi:MAG: hypothetical protein QOD92_383 [Acidimicrobiaceae bacterium]
MTFYDIPNKGTTCGLLMGGIIKGTDGNMWFTGYCGVYRVTPLGVVTFFDLGKTTYDIASGPDGALWFTTGLREVGRITTTGQVSYVSLPNTGNSGLITSGPGNTLWMVDDTPIVWQITSGQATTHFIIPESYHTLYNSRVNSITAGADGAFWLGVGTSSFVRLDSAGNVSDRLLRPGPRPSAASAGALVRAADATYWLSDVGSNYQVYPDGTIRAFTYPQSSPTGDTIGDGVDGRPWFSASNSIGRIQANGTTQAWNYPGNNRIIVGAAPGGDGNEWFVDQNGVVGTVNPNSIPDVTVVATGSQSYVTPSANYTQASLPQLGSAGPVPPTTDTDPSTVCCNIPRPPGAHWYLRNTPTAGPADIALRIGPWPWRYVAGDWDHSGREAIGIFDSGRWWLMNPSYAYTLDYSITYGAIGPTNAIPVIGDWNGDGFETIGIWEPSNATFYLRDSNTPGPPDKIVHYGDRSYTPVIGDWNGDGVDTIGVYANGWWYLRNSNTPGPPDLSINYGDRSYTPVVGDWNGDNVDTVGVYTGGSWYLRNANTPGSPQLTTHYGASGYVPVVGRWSGTLVSGIGVVTTG